MKKRFKKRKLQVPDTLIKKVFTLQKVVEDVHVVIAKNIATTFINSEKKEKKKE